MIANLPMFEPGERVILHYHPIENSCPLCGHVYGSLYPPFTEEVTILAPADTNIPWICLKCKGRFSRSVEGWWWVESKKLRADGIIASLPYTLLEKIEGEVKK